LWSVSDPSATTIANYEHDGSTVFAKKKIVGHTAWFLGIPPIDANWWRCLLAESGVHFYTEDGVVYAGGGLLVFHTKTGGDQKIRLKNGKEVLVEMPVGAGTVVVK
jgi:hypothetical protein